jgi:hypothetical protein
MCHPTLHHHIIIIILQVRRHGRLQLPTPGQAWVAWPPGLFLNDRHVISRMINYALEM